MIRRASSSVISSYNQRLYCKTVYRCWYRHNSPLTHVAAVNSINQSLARNIHGARPMDNISHISRMNMSHTATSYTLPITIHNYFQLRNTSHAETPKSFSTAAASNSTNADTSSNSTSSSSKSNSKSQQSKDEKSKKDDNSNLFLDNLGKIFLSAIGIVLVTLLRSTRSNNSRKELVEDIESTALLDPLEIDDLRLSNSDFNVEVWEKIAEEIRREFPSRDKVTYPEFLTVVMRTMREMKGEGFTIQFGHLVDRVVIAELERTASEDENTISGEEARLLRKEMPLSFLFAALSLALHSTVTDRVRVLYESMLNEMDTTPAEDTTVSGEQVSQMIRHLQNTCQLVPGAQVVETNSKVPYQTYRVGTGDELTQRARGGYGGKKGTTGVTKESEGPVSLEDFHAILNSKTVCAWGECYVKKTGRTSSSDR